MFQLWHEPRDAFFTHPSLELLDNEGSMKMFRLALMALTIAAATVAASAQTTPVPRPFPGAPTPPRTSSPAPNAGAVDTSAPSTSVAAPAQPTPEQPVADITPTLPGVPALYPTAEYLDTIDAGSGQSYVLYGANAAYSDVVTYYRTVLKNGGREIYRTPGTHQFDLGRFDDNRMAYPPSIVIKDYAGGTAPGYLHASGTEEKRYRTIIQIVPPPAATR
jgi:hypothetical protein